MDQRGSGPGGIVHAYQKYDPVRFPPPAAPPPDLASAAFEHMLRYGSTRDLTEEDLARAVRIDPSQIAGLGPSLHALIAMLEQRKRRILQTYEAATVRDLADRLVREQARSMRPPAALAREFHQAVRDAQIRDLERLWYRADVAARRDRPGSPPDESLLRFARDLLHLRDRLGEKYQVDELASKYHFTGRRPMDVPTALAVKEELETIDRLLEQLREALRTARIGIVDLEELSRFVEEADVERLRAFERTIRDYLREQAELQGLEEAAGSFRLGPKAMRLFQRRLLREIFGHLQAARSGRHTGPIAGEGVVEMPRTRPYEFGDSIAHMDVTQSFVNAMLREAAERRRGVLPAAPRRPGPMPPPPVRLRPEDIEVHQTRNTPKCATCVILDMSGSMRYDGQYVQAKRMALALEGLIRTEYPGDVLRFIELCTFARLCPVAEVPRLLPKPVTLHQSIVRLRADMSQPGITEMHLPPHFTNIQHALRLARQVLAAQDTPNRQVILITDGLPTAHFDGPYLYLLYPPDPATEEATMREAARCTREQITINIFLLPNWWQSSEDVQFAHRLAERTGGRVFFTAGRDLDRYVLWDYVARRRSIIG